MHRPYSATKYKDLVDRLRAVQPQIAITTDIIVGFPGETDDDYQATRQLVEDVQFDNAFIFKYSQRRDTPAASMDNQLSEEVKLERNHDLLEVVNQLARSKTAAYIGSNVEVLCEGPSKTNRERLTGRTRTNKIVVFEGSDRLIGGIFDIHIEHASPFTLYGNAAVLA